MAASNGSPTAEGAHGPGQLHGRMNLPAPEAISLNAMKPVKLSELIEALEFDSDEHITKVDLQNGCVVSVDRFVLSAVVEGDEASLDDLPDWQKPEVEIARAI